jgi:hypothetical protein
MRKTLALVLLAAAIWLLGKTSGYCSYSDDHYCNVLEAPSGSIAFTNITISATNICLGSGICASAQASVTCSETITESDSRGWHDPWPPPTYSTNTSCPYFITNWWTVTGVPVDNPSGSGTTACFTPTNRGTGTITFYGTWKDTDPCTGQPIGGGTISKSQSFTVNQFKMTFDDAPTRPTSMWP